MIEKPKYYKYFTDSAVPEWIRNPFITLLLFIAAFASCKSRADVFHANENYFELDIRGTINQKEKLHVLTDLTAAIKYIPLEKNESCLLYGIQKLYVDKDHIFIADRMGLYQFDIYGGFIRRIGGPGRGPGEHGRDIKFCIDAFNGLAYIFCRSNGTMNIYNIETGLFIRAFYIGFRVSDLAVTTNGNIVIFTSDISPGPLSFTINEVILSDNNGLIIDSIPNFNRLNSQSTAVGYVNLFNHQNSEFRYNYNFSDTLYVLNENFSRSVDVILSLENTIKREKLFTEMSDGIQIPDFLWINNIIGNSRHLYITIERGMAFNVERDLRYILYDQQNKDLFPTHGFINDIDGGMTFWPQFSIKNKLIAWHEPYRIIEYYNSSKGAVDHSESFTNLVKTLDDSDNPVLVLIDLSD